MSSGHQMSKRSAFSLVILLVGMTVALIVLPTALTTFRLTSEQLSSSLDKRTAVNRAQSAASLPKLPVFYCGYGMPSDAEDFKRAFFSQQNSEPFNWDGPISVLDRDGKKNAELRLVYGMPGYVAANYSYTKSGSVADVSLKKQLAKDYDLIAPCRFGKPSNVKNWILFGAMMPPASPLAVKNIAGSVLRTQCSASGFVIPTGDEIYLLRAVKVYCAGGALYTQDYRSSGAQPRVQGIEDLRFELDKEAGKLTMYILSRGNMSGTDVQPLNDADEWPDEYKTAAASCNCRLYASKITWSLPNCLDAEFSSVKNIAAQF